jgi:hypothetical protein
MSQMSPMKKEVRDLKINHSKISLSNLRHLRHLRMNGFLSSTSSSSSVAEPHRLCRKSPESVEARPRCRQA